MEQVKTKPNYVNPSKDVISLERGKIPPQAIDLEQVVLGAMMIDKKGVDDESAIKHLVMSKPIE